MLCADLVEVTWTDTREGARKVVGNLCDFSPGGVGLLLDHRLPQGTRVEFAHSGRKVSGNVRHCTHSEIGWIVGVRFEPDSQWDAVAHPPGHMLDPQSLPDSAGLCRVPHPPGKIGSTICCLLLGEALRHEKH
jgi:hypothetical protein